MVISNHFPCKDLVTNIQLKQQTKKMDVSKNRGNTPKMDGENNRNPYEQMDDLGGKHPYFWKHPNFGYRATYVSLPTQHVITCYNPPKNEGCGFPWYIPSNPTIPIKPTHRTEILFDLGAGDLPSPPPPDVGEVGLVTGNWILKPIYPLEGPGRVSQNQILTLLTLGICYFFFGGGGGFFFGLGSRGVHHLFSFGGFFFADWDPIKFITIFNHHGSHPPFGRRFFFGFTCSKHRRCKSPSP